MATPAVGCRVRILKEYATVRYIGPVANQQGTWVGVEWDDPSRGKHDGSTAGVRYFTCSSPCTTAGSFVRIERVCFGVTVLDALRARYNNETAEHGEVVGADELYVHTSRQRRVQVRLVGEEKIQRMQRQIHMLQSARLVGLDVSAVGDPSQLRSAAPLLSSLDLTSNLVATWAFLEQLAQPGEGGLPLLQLVNLSDNKIKVPPPASPPVRLPGLKVLVLNDCGLAWSDVLRLAPAVPSLEELHLCGNPITSLEPTSPPEPPPPPPPPPQPHPPPPPPGPESPGSVAPIEEVAQRGAQESDGAGQAVRQPAEQAESGSGGDEAAAAQLAALFPKLQILTLEDCQLVGWPTLELLRHLPALTRLHVGANPGVATITYPGNRTAKAVVAGAAAGAAAEAQVAAAPAEAEARTAAAAAEGAAVGAAVGAAGGPSAAFPRLKSLFLGGCGVADWGSVNQLDCFPALKEVRLTGNPVLALSKTGGRFEVIGRVSGLAQLNGAEVRPRERRDSEMRYLQHIAAEMEAAGADEARKAAVRTAHPRLRKLMELHGAVLATAARGGDGGGSLASRTVELKLTCVAAGATAKMGSQVKKLPRSTTVSALRLLCERLFKVKSDQMALFLRAPGDPLPEDIGAEDLADRPLGFFGVQDGYEVLIDEADPEELRRVDADARAAAAAAHEQRLAEQLRAAERMQAEFARSMGLPGQQQ